MHIVYVTGDFAHNKHDKALGGMAKAVFLCAKGMIEKGHKVRIITADTCTKKWVFQGINITSIRSSFNVNKKGIKMYLHLLEREFQLEKEISNINREEPIDVIQYTGWFGVGLLHNKKIPAVMRISTYSKVQLVGEYSKTKLELLSILERIAAKKMDAVYAPCRNTALVLQREIKKKVYILQTPYVDEKISESEKVYQDKINGKKYILFFGRMSVDKGIDVIKDILFKLFYNNEDLYFVFAGGGAGKKVELQKAAKDYREHLIFLGRIPHEELFPIIKKAELIIMPSIMDNFPNSCAEAMAMGKIVVGTDGSSLEQFITHGVSGFLTEINNSQDLLEKIQLALLLESKQKEEISKNAIKRIKKLDPEKYYQKIENLYKYIIAAKGE